MKRLIFKVFELLLGTQRAFLSLLARLLFVSRNTAIAPRTILVLRTGGLGDFLFAVPSMVVLRRTFPSSKIVVLTTSSTHRSKQQHVEAYVGGNNWYPWLDFIMPHIVDAALVFRYTTAGFLWKEIRPEIRKLDPDVTFILAHPAEQFSNLARKLLFLRFVGVRRNVYGWRTRATEAYMRKTQYKAGLYPHKIMGPLRSIAEYPLIPVLDETDIAFNLNVDPKARRFAEEQWNLHKWSGRKVIGFSPGAMFSHKTWPLENYIELGRHLLLDPDVVLIALGAPEDRHLGQIMCNVLGQNCVNFIGEINLSQAAAVLQRTTLLIANDVGATHLATAVGCRCVTIRAGFEYPGTEPWFSRNAVARNPVPCSPCYSYWYCPLGHEKCIKDIPVWSVLALVKQSLYS